MTTPGPPATPPVAEPTCYRHPDRVTYVRCTRCDRPICSEDMIPAAVGFQCPDDVRAGNKGMRQPRAAFGGRAVTGDPGYVSRILIGINVAVYLLGFVVDDLRVRFFMIGDNGTVYGGVLGIPLGESYRLVTAAFLHGSLLHLLLNMFALFIFGPPLEATLGRARFAAVYMLGAVGGVAASWAFSPLGTGSLGASGAVFALFGAHLVVNRRMGRENGGLWTLLAINVVFGFVVANVDWRAHAGGFVAGLAATAAIAYAPRAGRTVVQWSGLALVLLVALGLSTWRTADVLSERTPVSVAEVASCQLRNPLGGSSFLVCLQS